MIYCYFSCQRDERLLELSVESLRSADPEAVVYVANDERDRAAVPPRCHEVLTRYNRGGSGTGIAAIEGELLTMKHILEREKADFVVKVDSDVWVNSVDKMQPIHDGIPEPDFLGFETSRMLLPSGAMYRLSKWAVTHALEVTQSRWRNREWNPAAVYAENFVIYHLIGLAPTIHSHLIPWAAHDLVGMGDDPILSREMAAEAVHCGEPLADGSPIAREHALCRMLRLKEHQTTHKK